MIEHGSTVALIAWAHRCYTQSQLAHVLASTSFTFDLSIYEMFVPLTLGTTTYIVKNILSPKVSEYPITLINTVPSAISSLYENRAIPRSVSTINLAGEKLKQSIVNQLCELPHVEQIYDLYGPSEDTTYSTYAQRISNGSDTIGRPIANTQLYVLNKNHQPLPQGVPGELYIAGAGLALSLIHI